MKRTKAVKHLGYAREHLQFLREAYVQVLRDQNFKKLDCVSVCGHNYFKEKLEEIRGEMEEAKERIAKFERRVI